MKFDRRVQNREIRGKIESLLRDVGLIYRCNVRIGDNDDGKILSGGEKKRLAFATEVRYIFLYLFIYNTQIFKFQDLY